MPYIVRQCLEEIERRGLEEVGIYRVSGGATDIQALKTAFDTSEFLQVVQVVQTAALRTFSAPQITKTCRC